MRIKPFDGTSDFAMWQLKMKAILIKEKCWAAVEEKYAESLDEAGKKEMDQIAHSEIIIRLFLK